MRSLIQSHSEVLLVRKSTSEFGSTPLGLYQDSHRLSKWKVEASKHTSGVWLIKQCHANTVSKYCTHKLVWLLIKQLKIISSSSLKPSNNLLLPSLWCLLSWLWKRPLGSTSGCPHSCFWHSCSQSSGILVLSMTAYNKTGDSCPSLP